MKLLAVLSLLLVSGFTFYFTSRSTTSPAAFLTGKWFDHILIIQFENHSEKEVLADPNFAKYAKMGRAFTDYYAITHPSQPNYWTQVAGDHFGITDDSSHDLPQTSVFDTFEENGVSWKAYMEAYPGNCNAASSVGTYYRKHNPMISFDRIRNNATRCSKIQNSKALDADLAAGTLPNYGYFSPDINNDGHNTGVKFAGNWLDHFLTPRLAQFPPKTLIVISWDEDDYTEKNKILVSLLDPHGSIFPTGSTDTNRYDHYSLLRTVEDNWGLPTLGRNDDKATPFSFN